jgi:PBP1b-binding outer membrane lipoprotein LpoB
MKKILTFFILIFLLSSCEKIQPIKQNEQKNEIKNNLSKKKID